MWISPHTKAKCNHNRKSHLLSWRTRRTSPQLIKKRISLHTKINAITMEKSLTLLKNNMNLFPDTLSSSQSPLPHTQMALCRMATNATKWYIYTVGDATERCVWLSDVSGPRDQSPGEVSTARPAEPSVRTNVGWHPKKTMSAVLGFVWKFTERIISLLNWECNLPIST